MTTTVQEDAQEQQATTLEPEVQLTPAPVRKPIVRPEIKPHGELPRVTGSFIGTFSP